MKSIKTKIIAAVIFCSLLSTVICGGISIVNSSKTSVEDSKRQMEIACITQTDKLNKTMQNVENSVNMVYSMAKAKIDNTAIFCSSARYVNEYTKKMLPILMESAEDTPVPFLLISDTIPNLPSLQADYFSPEMTKKAALTV